MDIKNIISRNSPIWLNEDEALFLIKEYIKAKKGVNINPQMNLTSFGAVRELHLLHEMAHTAFDYFKSLE